MKVKEKLAIKYIRAQLNILALVSPRAAARKGFQLFCTPGKRQRKKTSFPEKGERLSFRQDGRNVRGHRWVPSSGQPPQKKVLIAHGFESSSRNFAQYVQPLLEKGFEVLAFDAPGHGRSGGKRITLPGYVKSLQTIQESYGPIDNFIGHSFGGLALTLLLEDLPHDEHSKLVLIAPLCELSPVVEAFFELLQTGKEVRREFEEISQERFDRPFSWYSIGRALQDVHADTIWVQDADDRVTPMEAAMRVKRAQHPNVQFVITKGLGHRKIYRDPAVIARIVGFLHEGDEGATGEEVSAEGMGNSSGSEDTFIEG